MGIREERYLVAGAVAVALAGIGVAAVGTYLDPPPQTGRLETLWVLSWPGMPVVGAVILWRRPGNRVGAALLAVGTGIGVGLGCSALLEWLTGPPAVVTAVLVAGQVSGLTVGFGSLPLVLLYYPSGGLPPRLRLVPPVVATLVAVTALFGSLRPGYDTLSGRRLANPMGLPGWEPVLAVGTTIGVLGLMGCGALAIGYTVVGTRRAVGVERLQRRWFTLAVVVFVTLFAAGVVSNEVLSEEAANPFIYTGFVLGINGIAAAVGVAVLRYRLYEIDRLVSRTVTYTLVTAALVAVYALITVVPTMVFDLQSDLLVAAATLAAAAAFGPVRRTVQAHVDRRFNRSRYDATRVADRFATRLRDEVDIDDLTADLREVVTATVQPAHVSLWLGQAQLPGVP